MRARARLRSFVKFDLYCGDNLKATKEWISSDSVDMILCSPPYGKIRDYKGFAFDFEALSTELLRVLRPGGMMCWVENDQYEKGGRSLLTFEHSLYFKKIGFNIHDVMIFEKHNFSNPSQVRYHQIYEYIICASKGKPKTFNPIKDKPNKWAGKTAWGNNTKRQKDGSFVVKPKVVYADFGMRSNIWRVQVGKRDKDSIIAYKHPAVFPLELAADLIKSWTNEGDVVYDPFAGAGTTLIAAKELKRGFVGAELSREYCEIAKERFSAKFGEELNIYGCEIQSM